MFCYRTDVDMYVKKFPEQSLGSAHCMLIQVNLQRKAPPMNENPVVLHIPHSSCFIPEFLREDIILGDDELKQNFYAFTDWKTDDLFSHPNFSTRIVSDISRMVCDMERFRNDDDEEMAAHGFGAVYINDAFMRPLRNFDKDKRERILQLYYDPYHKKLENAVDDKIQKFGKCLIIDCHSFSGTPLPYEPQQDSMRPSFCLGTLEQHTSQQLIDTAVNALKSPEHSVELNYPYAGSMIPLKYINDQRVQTIMVEINRTLYQKQGCLLPTQNYNSIKNKISSLLKLLTSSF